MKTYVPLHLHSDDSLLDGLGTISDYIKKAGGHYAICFPHSVAADLSEQ